MDARTKAYPEICNLEQWVKGLLTYPRVERVVHRGAVLTSYITRSGVTRVAVTPSGSRYETLSIPANSPTALDNIEREVAR